MAVESLEEIVEEARRVYREIASAWEEEFKRVYEAVREFHRATGCWPLGVRIPESYHGPVYDLLVDGASVRRSPGLLPEARRRAERVARVKAIIAGDDVARAETLLWEARELERAAQMADALDQPLVAALARARAARLRAVAVPILRWRASLLARLGCWGDRGPHWSIPWEVLEEGV